MRWVSWYDECYKYPWISVTYGCHATSTWNGHDMVFPAPNMITYIDPTQFTSK